MLVGWQKVDRGRTTTTTNRGFGTTGIRGFCSGLLDALPSLSQGPVVSRSLPSSLTQYPLSPSLALFLYLCYSLSPSLPYPPLLFSRPSLSLSLLPTLTLSSLPCSLALASPTPSLSSQPRTPPHPTLSLSLSITELFALPVFC